MLVSESLEDIPYSSESGSPISSLAMRFGRFPLAMSPAVVELVAVLHTDSRSKKSEVP